MQNGSKSDVYYFNYNLLYTTIHIFSNLIHVSKLLCYYHHPKKYIQPPYISVYCTSCLHHMTSGPIKNPLHVSINHNYTWYIGVEDKPIAYYLRHMPSSHKKKTHCILGIWSSLFVYRIMFKKYLPHYEQVTRQSCAIIEEPSLSKVSLTAW